MKVYSSLEEASDGSLAGRAVCLGNFDGVHLGHQALCAEARRHGEAVALTFSPHPGKVLQPQLAPRLIAEPMRKLELLEAQGLAAVIVQPFTLDFAHTGAQAFEEALFDRVRARWVVVGADFTYGARRSGTVETLRAAAGRRGAEVLVVPTVSVDGVVVSSSHVREYILEGRVEAAARLLGRPFDLDGEVVHGEQRGRTIGFPTANLATGNELRPAPGVYAVQVGLLGSGEWWGGAANLGVKPTFGGAEITIEAHLLDFTGDLYGQRVRLQFLERLRSEQKYGSVDQLIAQIERDVLAAREALARRGGKLF
jgi:riboflavin kinase/FMN adenylyltransferase